MRLVIKIGTALISRGNRINIEWLDAKVKEIAELHSQGHQIIIVSSGAVAAGMEIEKLFKRPNDTLKLQLLSGEGQIKLMKYYKDYFKEANILIAQVLLTHHNFASKNEEESIKTIMEAYLRQGTIPVVEVKRIDRRIKDMASKETNPLGLGGMHSKVRAAEMVAKHGIETIVANGRFVISDVLNHRVRKTVFRAGLVRT